MTLSKSDVEVWRGDEAKKGRAGPTLRIMLAFQHVDLGNSQIRNMAQLGLQASVF